MSERERHVRWDDPRETLARVVERRLSGLEFLRAMAAGEIPPPPIGLLLGFTIESAEPGSVTFGFQPAEHHYNPNCVVHGGVAATLLDTVVGCAVTTLLPFGTTCATLELKVSYIRSLTADSPWTRCTGAVLHHGRRSAVAEGRLLAPDGKLIAHATSTLLVIGPGEDPHGSRSASSF